MQQNMKAKKNEKRDCARGQPAVSHPGTVATRDEDVRPCGSRRRCWLLRLSAIVVVVMVEHQRQWRRACDHGDDVVIVSDRSRINSYSKANAAREKEE